MCLLALSPLLASSSAASRSTVSGDFGGLGRGEIFGRDHGLAPPDAFVNSGTPDGVPPSFDCEARKLVYEYGRKRLPQVDRNSKFVTLFDAMQLQACGETRPQVRDLPDSVEWTPPMQQTEQSQETTSPIFVDADNGNDHASGDVVRTLQEAVRRTLAKPKDARTVVMHGGVHRVNETIKLGPEHSGLRVVNAPGETAIISGAVPLTLAWEPLQGEDNVFYATGVRSQLPSGVALEALRVSEKANERIPLLTKRATRARYPNGDPETMMRVNSLDGFVTASTTWSPPKDAPDAETVVVEPSDWPSVEWPASQGARQPWTGMGAAGQFHIGVGGTCVDVTPPAGYWCASDAPRNITRHSAPSGVHVTSENLPNFPYKNATGAVVFAWRPYHWYTNMWRVGGTRSSNQDDESTELWFSHGGYQGGEGETTGAEWFIENVREELDAPNEWFYDETSDTLFYVVNGTATMDSLVFEAVVVKSFVDVRGTSSNPVTDVSVSGIVFRDTAPTYLDVHGLPSGGDWALHKGGAITAVGVRGLRIESSLFARIDGNAIYLGGYARDVVVDGNEFVWIGGTAIASWGDTSTALDESGRRKPLADPIGPDGRSGEQPRGTVIANNLAHEVGIYQKQSSFYFQAISALTQISGNVVFNGPRAHINFNDGFGGGDVIADNLLANSCRESGDHGPFNSWDRVPYIHNLRGKSSVIPVFRNVHNNLVLATYQSQEAFDTDDGSSYYYFHDNVELFADTGFKSDFGGRKSTSNHLYQIKEQSLNTLTH